MGNFVNQERLAGHLRNLFSLGDVRLITPVHGGLLCENFRIETSAGYFFLKQYRKQTSSWVHEIKFSEQYFSENDIPVVLPKIDSQNRPAFWFEDNWYSLFPFVEGKVKEGQDLTENELSSIGSMLAKIHHAGMHFSNNSRRAMPVLRLWDRGRFFLEFPEIYRAASEVENPDEADMLYRRTLERKKQFVASNSLLPEDLDLASNCLIHGDFQQGNVFFDDRGEIKAVFDFEKTSIGPRAFEVARSLMISGFDHGFETDNFERGRIFLNAYRKDFPISFDEFHKGVVAYIIDISHQLWIESKRYLKDSKQYDDIYKSHAARIERLNEGRKEFCRKIYG